MAGVEDKRELLYGGTGFLAISDILSYLVSVSIFEARRLRSLLSAGTIILGGTVTVRRESCMSAGVERLFGNVVGGGCQSVRGGRGEG